MQQQSAFHSKKEKKKKEMADKLDQVIYVALPVWRLSYFDVIRFTLAYTIGIRELPRRDSIK